MNYSNEVIEQIRKRYDEYERIDSLNLKFGCKAVRFALTGQRRCRRESSKLAHERNPKSFEHTLATKQRISLARKKYLQKHPDKVPYKLNHSSRKSWPEEIFERALNRHNISGWIRRYMNGRYEYDFAFPLLKIDVEIDGNTHSLRSVKRIDKERDEWSKSQGWTVVRFDARHVLRNVEQCIQLLQKCLNNVNVDITCEIHHLFSMLRTGRERRCLARQQRQQEKQKVQQLRIEKIRNSKIDFSSFGWVKQVAELIDILPQKVNHWMKKNMPDFFRNNCFRSKTSMKNV